MEYPVSGLTNLELERRQHASFRAKARATQTLHQSLEKIGGGRAAFLVGTVARDTPLRFSLGNVQGKTDRRCEGSFGDRSGQHIGVYRRDRSWAEWTLLREGIKRRTVSSELAAFGHTHRAVMLSISSAARGQA